jgi:RNA polymerase sigma-70 factor (ECF subfamily)
MSKTQHLGYENEEAIMRSFRQGDKDAFCWIYDQVAGPLTFFVENMIFNHTDAEDIVANSFYKLCKARETLQSVEHVKRWLYVIARNESIDYIRRRGKVREIQTDVSYLSSDIEPVSDTERVRTMLLQAILKEIDQLPSQRQKILKLYFFDQKSTGEIAEITGLNSQTVLNHKAKALESLRKTGLKLKWLVTVAVNFLVVGLFLIK